MTTCVTHFEASITAIPTQERYSAGYKTESWRCGHRHRYQEQAADCGSRELRRTYVRAPSRQNDPFATRFWSRITMAVLKWPED